MNRLTKILAFALLLPSVAAAERRFYANPENSARFSLKKDVNDANVRYSYYITNEYGIDVFRSMEKPEPADMDNGSVQERFITDLSEYYKPHFILLTWNFKRIQDSDSYCSDGDYTIHLLGVNAKNPREIVEEKIPLTLDTQKPYIAPRMTASHIYRNRRTPIVITVDSYAATQDSINSWEVLIDGKIVLYSTETENSWTVNHFPPCGIPLPQEIYSSLADGKHVLSVLATDCAGNSKEESVPFTISEEPFTFSIFSNDGITRRLDGRTEPYRFTAIGTSAQSWRTRILDAGGKEMYSATRESAYDEPCEPFSWNGIPEGESEAAGDGTYTAEIHCTDSTGNSASQNASFFIKSERKPPEQKPAVQMQSDTTSRPPALSGICCNGLFSLELKDCPKEAKSGILRVEARGETVRESEVAYLNNIMWNGTDDDGNKVVSSWELYTFTLTLKDDDGEEIGEPLPTSVRSGLILADGDGNRRRIIVPPVQFAPDESSVLSDTEFFARNAESVQRTANALLSEIGQDDILIVAGHASRAARNGGTANRREETELVALSERRAAEVGRLLEFNGIPRSQIKIEANGSRPSESYEEDGGRQNRLVEFFIEKAEKMEETE